MNLFFSAIGAVGGIKMANSFGREIIRGWGKQAGSAGVNFVENAFKQYNPGISSFFPGYGLGKNIINIMKHKPIQQVTKLYKEAAINRTSLNNEVRNQLRLDRVKEIHGSGYNENIRRIHQVTIRGMFKSGNRGMRNNFEEQFSAAFTKHGGSMASADAASLRGKVMDSATRSYEVAQQAYNSRVLAGTALKSNMAVIGFPTLASGVATYATAKAIYGIGRRRYNEADPMRV